MKKVLFKKAVLIFAGLLLFTDTFSQNSPAFDVGDNTIGISIGVGGNRHRTVYNYGYNYSYVDLPAFALTYDHGTFGEVGPGTIGIGGLIGYKYSFLRNYGDYDATWTDLVIGARGTYHLTLLKDKNNKFDPYAGVLLGIRFHTYNNSFYDDKDESYDAGGVLPAAGVFIGAKYNFTPGFGAFAELGYDISILRIGLNFNF